jgi:hypothetical protein
MQLKLCTTEFEGGPWTAIFNSKLVGAFVIQNSMGIALPIATELSNAQLPCSDLQSG